MAENLYAGVHRVGSANLEDLYRTGYSPDGGGLLNDPRPIAAPTGPGFQNAHNEGLRAGDAMIRGAQRGREAGRDALDDLARPGANAMTGALAATTRVGPAHRYMDPYYNPYTQQVIDTSLSDLRRERDRDLTQIGSRASAAGGFGGSRHGVREALGDELFYRTAASTAADLNQDMFNTALGAGQSDRDFLLQRADQRGSIGSDMLSGGVDLAAGAYDLEAGAGRDVAAGRGLRGTAFGSRANRNLLFQQALNDEPFDRFVDAVELYRGGTPTRDAVLPEEGSDWMDVLFAGLRNPDASIELLDELFGA